MNIHVVNLKNVVNLTQLITPRVESHELWVLPSSTFHVDPFLSSKFPRTEAPMCKNESSFRSISASLKEKTKAKKKEEKHRQQKKDLYDATRSWFRRLSLLS